MTEKLALSLRVAISSKEGKTDAADFVTGLVFIPQRVAMELYTKTNATLHTEEPIFWALSNPPFWLNGTKFFRFSSPDVERSCV